jgi:hypothetical protein
MSDFDENNNNSEEQVTNESQQTLTLDGKIYAMNALPAEAINVLNDLIRSENELNEHRFRIRTLSAAQQGLTSALNQFIAAAGIEPMPAADSDQDNDSQSDGEG